MPYGIPNETAADIKWVETCVASIQKENPKYPEKKCIRICKAKRITMKKEKGRK